VPDLEARLTDLGATISWPATPPDLWGGGRRSRPEAVWKRRLQRWPLAAAAIFLIAATLLTYSPTRDAIASWINVHTIFHRATQPFPTPSPLPSGPAGRGLDLGTPAALADAQAAVAWHIADPSSLGAPDAVYVKLPPVGPSQGEVSLVYTERPGIPVSGTTGVAVLVTEARGRINEPFFQKTLGPGVTIEQVSVGGRAGFWISGQPHGFVFVAADGDPYYDSLRLATNTLVFDDAGTVVRIEGELSKQQAIDIGRSLA
jgi:hypothetical protein